MAVEHPPTADTPGVDRAAVTRPRPGPRRSRRRRQVRPHRHPQRARARQRARNGGARRRRHRRAPVPRAARGHDRQPRGVDRVGLDTAIRCAVTFEEAQAIPADSELHCVSRDVEQQMKAVIDAAKEAGDTVGGSFEVIVRGLPIGLGSHVQWDRKLDGRLAQALMSIQAIKGVGIGRGPRRRGPARLEDPRRDPAARRCDDASGGAGHTADEQRRRSRGGHHQRRGPAGDRRT